MLFSVGGMFSLYEGWHKLHDPQPLKQWWWAAGVLVFGIIAEGVSMRACLVEVNKARGTRSLWRWFRESRQAELVVIFGEDLAALLGLVFALVAILVAVATGNPVWDAVGTIAIGVLLIVVAVFVAVEVKALLIGQSVDAHVQSNMRTFLESRPEIARVISLITLQLGSEIMVSVHAEMHERGSSRDLVNDINAVEADLKQLFPDVRWSFFETRTGRHGARRPGLRRKRAADRLNSTGCHCAGVTPACAATPGVRRPGLLRPAHGAARAGRAAAFRRTSMGH
jgi:divalent metal cation (Fe/Co/Zn/Cd) transporter